MNNGTLSGTTVVVSVTFIAHCRFEAGKYRTKKFGSFFRTERIVRQATVGLAVPLTLDAIEDVVDLAVHPDELQG